MLQFCRVAGERFIEAAVRRFCGQIQVQQSGPAQFSFRETSVGEGGFQCFHRAGVLRFVPWGVVSHPDDDKPAAAVLQRVVGKVFCESNGIKEEGLRQCVVVSFRVGTVQPRSEFAHLKEKHNIEPMDAKQWILREVRPANHPVLRLAQAAEFFLQDDFLMNRILLCTTEEDVCKLFCIEAGEYWLTHDIPGSEGRPRPKRLGAFKANIIGINLVVILQFAYGFFGGYMRYQEQALELLQRLPAEDNRYTRLWQAEGVKPQDAFESQALLQLITEHCLHQDCRQCPLAKRMVERL